MDTEENVGKIELPKGHIVDNCDNITHILNINSTPGKNTVVRFSRPFASYNASS